MVKLKILLFIASFSLTFKSFAQLKVGLDLSFYNCTLTNISPDLIVDYGYSGAKVIKSPSFGVMPTLVLRHDIYKKFKIETGLGYFRDKQKMNLRMDYGKDDPFRRPAVDTDLTYSLKYVQIPVLMVYSLDLKGQTKINLSAGVRTRFLFSQKDNYQSILYELISVSDEKFNKIVYAPTVGISLSNQIGNGHIYEFGFFGNYDVNPIVDKEEIWGFFENLYPARNLQTGISLKYFL